MTNEITWGDTVLVRSDAPAQFQPGTRGSISGFRDLGQEFKSTRTDVAQQARLYLVEFPDGKAIEIPEVFWTKLMTRSIITGGHCDTRCNYGGKKRRIFIAYLNEPDIHDAIVEQVVQGDRQLRVLVKTPEGRFFGLNSAT